jgi:predicted amidohydrolase
MVSEADMTRIGLLQMNSQENPIELAEWIVEQASAHLSELEHCAFVMAPENALYNGNEAGLAAAAGVIESEGVPYLCKTWPLKNVPLVLGGIPRKSKAAGKFHNSWVKIFGGSWAELYAKVHLFRATVPGQRIYDETRNFVPGGDSSVVLDLGGVKVGASTCFDLRFPEQYATLTRAGAQVLAVPSSFTKLTGEAHWHVLLRARAIETQCFVVAPAQVGEHAGKQTFGHSLVVSPWGDVILDAGTSTGLFLVDIRLEEITEVRRRIPLRT